MTPGAVVVGAHANGLGVIHALAARGVPAVSISTRPFDIAQHSRWVHERHALSSLHQQHEALVELLDHHAARWRGWAVFPTNDDALMALSQHHARLSSSYRVMCQPWDIAAPLVDKDQMHALAVACGLDVPTCYGAAIPATTGRPDLRFR